jgi:hypothetical protein
MRAPSLYGAIAQNRRSNRILCTHGRDFRANSTGVEEAEDAGGRGVGAAEVGEDGGVGASPPCLVELTAPLRGHRRRRCSHTSPLSSTSAGSETEGGELLCSTAVEGDRGGGDRDRGWWHGGEQ